MRIIDLDDHRPIWAVFWAECMDCAHRWVVVAPARREQPYLECPACGQLRGLRLGDP